MRSRIQSLSKLKSKQEITHKIVVFPKIQKKRIQQIKTSSSKNRNQIIQNQQKMANKFKKILNQSCNNQDIKFKRSQSNFVNKKEQNELEVTACCFGIYDQNLKPIGAYNEHQRRQIASITKIMTLLASLKLSQKYKVQLESTYFRISTNASNCIGTVADLDTKQWATVQDLLYALMLPSGNDAAIALAESFGAFLYYGKQGQSKMLSQIKSLDITNDSNSTLKLYAQNFVKFMNNMAKQAEMNQTNFANPHGLDCKQAYSTVNDIAIMMRKVLENQIALRIICTKNYFARLKVSSGKQLIYREADWINTNKLMWKSGFIGGKTGQTAAAGNCLASIYQIKQNKYFIIVLGCQGRQNRFSQTEKIVEHFLEIKQSQN